MRHSGSLCAQRALQPLHNEHTLSWDLGWAVKAGLTRLLSLLPSCQVPDQVFPQLTRLVRAPSDQPASWLHS